MSNPTVQFFSLLLILFYHKTRRSYPSKHWNHYVFLLLLIHHDHHHHRHHHHRPNWLFTFLGLLEIFRRQPFFSFTFQQPNSTPHDILIIPLSLLSKIQIIYFFSLSFSFFLPFSLYILHWLDFFFCSFFFSYASNPFYSFNNPFPAVVVWASIQ